MHWHNQNGARKKNYIYIRHSHVTRIQKLVENTHPHFFTFKLNDGYDLYISKTKSYVKKRTRLRLMFEWLEMGWYFSPNGQNYAARIVCQPNPYCSKKTFRKTNGKQFSPIYFYQRIFPRGYGVDVCFVVVCLSVCVCVLCIYRIESILFNDNNGFPCIRFANECHTLSRLISVCFFFHSSSISSYSLTLSLSLSPTLTQKQHHSL